MSTTFTCEEHVTDVGSTVKTQAHFAHAVSPTYLILRRKMPKTVFIANTMSKVPYSQRAQAHRGLLMSSELLSLPFQHLLWTFHCIRMFICDALWDIEMRASGRAEIIYLSLSWPSCLPFPRPVSPAEALTVHLKHQELICIKHTLNSHTHIYIYIYIYI